MPAQPVHIRNPRSPGGGWSPRDLIELPVWLLLLIAIIKWAWRNFLPILVALTVLILFIIALNDLATAIVYGMGLLFVIGLFIYGNAYWRYNGIRTIGGLTRCLWRKQKIYWRWEYLMKAAEVKQQPYPRPRRIRYSRNSISFKINTANIGKTSGDFAVNAPEIAAAMKALDTKVETPEPSKADIIISYGDPSIREIRPGDVVQTTKVNTVAPVNDMNGKPVDIPLATPFMIMGESDSGKSTLLWDYIDGLNKKKIPYRIRAVDPKGGVELSGLDGAPHTISYISDPEKIDDFLREANTQLDIDLDRMKKKGIRNAPISKEFPLDLMIIDELLLLPKYDAQSAIGKRLATGRAANHGTVALSQLSQKVNIGEIRDLFPIRFCLATSSTAMTDAILGDGAEKMGAKCSKIDTPGVGYMYKDGSAGFVKFKAANIYDDETEIIAQGGVIEATTVLFTKKLPALTLRKTSVYKFFNSEGRLLYTGMAWNFEKRRKQHAGLAQESMKKWWPEVDESETQVTEYPNRRAARKAELWSIKHENPKYNIADKV